MNALAPRRPGARARRTPQLAASLKASRRAEVGYVRAVGRIFGEIHRETLARAHARFPAPETRHDAAPKDLGPAFERQVFAYIKKTVPPAFDAMGEHVIKANDKAMKLIGIPPRSLGLGGLLVAKRAENVDLITRASSEFLGQVRKVLDKMDGARVEEIASALQARVGVSDSRANLIARDQTLKLNAQIAQHRMTAAGVTKYTWSTSRDERVRPLHAELEGQTFRFDDPPITNDQGDRNNPGEDFQCFPGDSELDFADGVVKGFRRWYDGELAGIVTASGKTIRATPNHPVLTARGWVPAGSLKLSDYVLEVAEQRRAAPSNHQHDRITRLAEVFASLQVGGVRRSAAGAQAHFHGDGSEHDVDIVFATRPLRFGRLTCGKERLDELALSEGDPTRLQSCALDELVVTPSGSPNRAMGGRSEVFPLAGRQARHSEQVGRGPSAQCNPGPLQSIREHVPPDASAPRNGQHAFTPSVRGLNSPHIDLDERPGSSSSPVGLHADSLEFFAKIVGIDSEEPRDVDKCFPFRHQLVRVRSIHMLAFSGHVYNLETATGWYAIDGIVAHNCRCVGLPVLDEDTEPESEERPPESGEVERAPEEPEPAPQLEEPAPVAAAPVQEVVREAEKYFRSDPERLATVVDYTGGGYHAINEYGWRGAAAYAEKYGLEKAKQAAEAFRNLEHALSGAPRWPGTVTRGMVMDRAQVTAALSDGKIRVPAFWSTSYEPSDAFKFHSTPAEVAVTAQITQRSGIPVEAVSHFEEEREILLPPHLSYEIEGFAWDKEGHLHLTLREL